MASLWRVPSPSSASPGKGNPTSAAADGNDDASEQGGAASVAAKRANAAGGSSERPPPLSFPLPSALPSPPSPVSGLPPSGKGRQRSSPLLLLLLLFRARLHIVLRRPTDMRLNSFPAHKNPLCVPTAQSICSISIASLSGSCPQQLLLPYSPYLYIFD